MKIIGKPLFKKFIIIFSAFPVTSFIFLVVASSGIAFLFYMSQVFWRVNWYSQPDFSFSYLLRTFIIAASVTFIAIGFKTSHVKDELRVTFYQKILVFFVIFITVICYILCVLFPYTAKVLGEEDNLIEWISFVVLFLGLAIIILVLKRFVSLKRIPLAYLSLILFTLLLFTMGMEEISWGQRIFEFKTPDKFQGNSQNELNFHNFKTTEVDTAYYIGIWVLFIILPYLKMCYPIIFSKGIFRLLVPEPYIIFVGALPFAFNYNKWNLLFTQIWFFCALVIILILAISQRKYSNGRFFFLEAFLICFMQITFLASDNSSPVLLSGRISEYKELISQVLLLVYSGDVYLKAQELNKPEAGLRNS